MISATDAFKAFLFGNQIREPFIKVVFENTGIDTEHGLESYDLDVTEFIAKFGSINRELNLDHGLFRPGSNSLSLRNTKDLGDYLFSLRKRFGGQLWNDKTYHIYFGFKQFPIAVSVAGGLPKLSTLGFGGLPSQALPTSSPASLGIGDTPAGEPSVDSATEETVRIYTGDIQQATYDRINDVVQLQSRDFYQRLVDFKVCKKLLASDIFSFSSSSNDNRSIQHIIKYGTHKLITRGSSLTDRNDPFSATICIPNTTSCDTKYGSINSFLFANNIFYLPMENDLITSGYAAGTLKLWYWDYIVRIWRAFPVSYFSNGYIAVYSEWSYARVNPKGIYFAIVDPSNCKVGVALTDTWQQYLAGDGAYFAVTGDTSKIDVVVCAESVALPRRSVGVKSNPVSLIHDLLISKKFMYIDQYLTDLLDTWDFATSGYSFDDAYIFYDQEGVDINTRYLTETSVSKIIEDICSLVGAYIYMTADRDSAERRSLRMKVDKAYNPCKDVPPNLLVFSTKDRLSNYETILSKNEYFDRVTLLGFDSSYSTRGVFDLIVKGDGNKVLSLGSDACYYYDCSVAAQGIADRLYNKFIKPTEIIEIGTDASGVLTELADYVKVHDHKLDEEIVGEVYKHNFDLQNKVKISARRYTKLLGPDENNPWKVYAFCGCARAGTNGEGGSGSDASIASGSTTVTFVGDFDQNKVKVGMALRIESTMFWIASITDATHVEVGTAATATLTNEDWSIGKSYHTR